ncbi:hypothetical protein DCAR_0934933 [Daucus carota subsp. sativus]|uniref:Reverse transcriptase zinc-binding domain-containing protein n=1 Tax=Daucus carota subsp. sativus TaxID=79200 RepID=A0AAF1BDH6_DAUCS|nr:PREDICTED: uncharacterized protein LOC108201452 [Daucus carota subsp. sativus]WOH15395.1 hypothetical protein DCAR_0934933 [Daucus carota subsp. sativus]
MGLDDSFTSHWRKVWSLRIAPKISLFLWKYQHDILPIQKVLNSRVPLKFSPNCSLCGIEEESRAHLFWNCYLVRKVWIVFLDWWSLNRNVMNGHGDLFLLFRCLKGVALREAWHTSVIALLWTIWLARNERIFSKQDWNEEKLVWLIKIRAFEWLLAAGKMARGLESLWKVNPRGSCLLFNKKHKGRDFIWCNTNFIGYSDGSWKLLPDNSVRCGVGCCITDLEDNLIFIFSSPGKANSPLEAEREALLFLYTQIIQSSQLHGIFTLCTNSKVLEKQFLKARAGYKEEESLNILEDWENLVKDKRFKIQFVFRDKLIGADSLAKDGGKRKKMMQAWC